MSWVLTREDDADFSQTFDTLEEAAEHTHTVDSDTPIGWHFEEVTE